VQFLDPVLQRGTGQDDGKGRLELFHGHGGAGLPVLDSLGLVQDDEVRPPFTDLIQVPMHQFIIEQLEEGVRLVERRPLEVQPLDDLGSAVGEFLNL